MIERLSSKVETWNDAFGRKVGYRKKATPILYVIIQFLYSLLVILLYLENTGRWNLD